uniref:NAD(P)/FAD-dependent oxidoreductase n=1 Tax=Agathobacter sp. TaxID=2021311 RepID=UPI0040576903
MIQINQIKLPVSHSEAELVNKIRKILRLDRSRTFTYRIEKKSLDARKKPELYYVYSCLVNVSGEQKIVKKANTPSVFLAKDKTYRLPKMGEQPLGQQPLIVGAGPSGLFAAYVLAEAGFCPVILERGKPVEERMKDVAQFWETGILNTGSNVQFGEGGAGTFSDGKLNTLVKDPANRNRFVLETFVRFGAPEAILYENKPHIGTDILCGVIRNMRHYLIEKGVTVRFDTCVTDFVIENNVIREVVCKTEHIPVSVLILALGHSARDTFERLHALHVPMEAKNFAVGFRVEHPQSMIDEAMYGLQQKSDFLPPSPYKVTANFPNGRGVYSFCMCPGGFVVNASSEEQRLAINGMSYSKRNSSTANSAIIVSVGMNDFAKEIYANDSPLMGLAYQRHLEQKAYLLANGKIPQQLFGDFKENRISAAYGDFSSNVKGNTAFANLRGLLNPEMEGAFLNGMNHFGHIIPNFDRNDAILSGIESRTSSPVRILRNEAYESIMVKGLYPCGEGAGYAGGITSAAMDGIKAAEAIIKKYNNK